MSGKNVDREKMNETLLQTVEAYMIYTSEDPQRTEHTMRNGGTIRMTDNYFGKAGNIDTTIYIEYTVMENGRTQQATEPVEFLKIEASQSEEDKEKYGKVFKEIIETYLVEISDDPDKAKSALTNVGETNVGVTYFEGSCGREHPIDLRIRRSVYAPQDTPRTSQNETNIESDTHTMDTSALSALRSFGKKPNS